LLETQLIAPALYSAIRRRAKTAAASLLPRSWLLVRGPRAQPRVALTFDDGPTELTSAFLELLEQHRARATFFLVGKLCERLPEMTAAIARAGHQVGGHGFTHRLFPELTNEELLDELERTDRLLPGPKNGRRLVRPPHGSVSARSLIACARAGYVTALWSHDVSDSRARSAREVIAGFERNPPSAGEIVLLHEDHRQTLEALPQLLTELSARGYELVTLDELFRPEPAA
jgi:peptidoglycan-N-acetylglucosamine deacetylase